MFRRAREAIRRAFRRLWESVYRGVKGFEVRSAACAIPARMRDLDFGFRTDIESIAPALPEPMIESDEIVCSVASLSAAIQAVLAEDSKPPVPDTEVARVDTAFAESAIQEDEMSIGPAAIHGADTVVNPHPKLFKLASVRLDAKLFNVAVVMSAEGARVVDGRRWASIVPMARRRIEFVKLTTGERVRLWSELVRQTGKRPNELELIGVFPGVPVRGIKRLGFEGGSGNLRIWLEGVIKRSAQDTPTRTLILARERASGKLHRVFDSA
jgi:hypothetical protein